MLDQLLLQARQLFQPQDADQTAIPRQLPALPWNDEEAMFF
jgi:hypothetical protein